MSEPSHTTTTILLPVVPPASGARLLRMGVEPSNSDSVAGATMTWSLAKNCPCRVIGWPNGSSAMFVPLRNTPTGSTYSLPTYSGYSSEPTM